MFLPLIFAELDCLAYFLTCVALKSKRTIKNVHIINCIDHPKILVHSRYLLSETQNRSAFLILCLL